MMVNRLMASRPRLVVYQVKIKCLSNVPQGLGSRLLKFGDTAWVPFDFAKSKVGTGQFEIIEFEQSLIDSLEGEGFGFPCPTCGRRFRSEQSMVKHCAGTKDCKEAAVSFLKVKFAEMGSRGGKKQKPRSREYYLEITAKGHAEQTRRRLLRKQAESQ